MKPQGFKVTIEAWKSLANCKNEDSSLFILSKGQSSEPAKQICKQCKVRQPCLEYGIRTGSVGVWGGKVLVGRNDPVEIYPVLPIPENIVRVILANNPPAILGKASSFKQLPGILGKQAFFYSDQKAINGP